MLRLHLDNEATYSHWFLQWVDASYLDRVLLSNRSSLLKVAPNHQMSVPFACWTWLTLDSTPRRVTGLVSPMLSSWGWSARLDIIVRIVLPRIWWRHQMKYLRLLRGDKEKESAASERTLLRRSLAECWASFRTLETAATTTTTVDVRWSVLLMTLHLRHTLLWNGSLDTWTLYILQMAAQSPFFVYFVRWIWIPWAPSMKTS